jgi:hypothetical protein
VPYQGYNSPSYGYNPYSYNYYGYGGYSGGYNSYPYSYYGSTSSVSYSPPEVSTPVVGIVDPKAIPIVPVAQEIQAAPVVVPVVAEPVPVAVPPVVHELTTEAAYGWTDVEDGVGHIGANSYWWDEVWGTWRQIL